MVDELLLLSFRTIGLSTLDTSFRFSIGKLNESFYHRINCQAGESRDGDCDCNELSVETLQLHHHVETEDNAWAYEIIEPPNCSIYVEDRLISGAPICSDPYALSYWQDEDYCFFGDYFEDPSLTPWLPFSLEDGKNTFFVGKDAASEWTLELGAGCGEGNPPWHKTLSASFGSADIYNPVFEEDPRIVFGPEAADWMESKLAHPGAHPGAFTQQYIDIMREDICGAYLLVDVYDGHNEPGAMGGIAIDIMDRFGNYDPPQGMAALGGEIWIDRGDLYYQEYVNWADPSHDPLPADAKWYHEELVMAFEVTITLLYNPQNIRVRAVDFEQNWKRSDDLLASEGIESYSVLDLFYWQNTMYSDEICFLYDGPPDACVGCDGWVKSRTGGETALDIIAAVSAYNPPDSIEVVVNKPEDITPSESVRILLYRIDCTSPDWNKLWMDLHCQTGTNDICVEFYGRYREGRVFTNCPIADPPALIVSDSRPSTLENPPVDYSRTPIIYLSSRDYQNGHPVSDEKDYTIAIGTCIDFLGPDPWIIANGAPFAFNYGDMIGWFDAIGGNSCKGECDTSSNVIEGYRDNIYNFGFSFIRSQAQGHEAYQPVQSETDIMLVHCHGCIDSSGDSYMLYFVNSMDAEFWTGDDPNPDTVLFATDWQSHGSLIGRDAQWLVTTACWLLADNIALRFPHGQNEPCHPDFLCDPWFDWQTYVYNTSPIESFCGWRHLHHARDRPLFPGCPYDCSDEIFWERYSEMMNDNYQGEDCRWVNQDPADDLSVRCYMEAAWEQLHGLLDARAGAYPFPDYTNLYLRAAAAVDAEHRYTLEEYYLDLDANKGYLIKTW